MLGLFSLFLFIQSTDSVTLDLLTYSDLELLRNRKAVSGGYQGNAKNRPASKQQENKRYLILVYSVEFDRYDYKQYVYQFEI